MLPSLSCMSLVVAAENKREGFVKTFSNALGYKMATQVINMCNIVQIFKYQAVIQVYFQFRHKL